MLASSP
jgi:hypothetical protein